MAVSIEDIKKLRTMTGAGLSDCKNALNEAEGNLEAAIELIRKRGQAIAAKRSDREAGEGCVLAKVDGNFGAICALKCETDFVAKNADFVALATKIINAAVAARCTTKEEVAALPLEDATVAELITRQSGVTGEKMELDGYQVVTGESIAAYDHQNAHSLCTLVAFNMPVADPTVGKNIAMQVASASPAGVNSASIPQETIDAELRVAVEKTREEQIQRAVVNAIKKAGFNPAHFDSEDHMESNQAKGWITAEDVAKVKEIIATESEKAAANIKDAMIQNIAQGRLKKFFKEVCLVEQEYIWDKALTVEAYLNSVEKGLTVTDFKRFTLRAE